jgi:hypothetical protein
LPEWPSVLKIANDEFQQSVAVAQLAVKLWENKIARVQGPLEKDKVRDEGPQTFLEEAWKLVQSSREHVLREQTDADYLAAHGGSHEAAENVVGRIRSKSRIQFRKLCDPKRNKGDTEIIPLFDVETGKTIEVEWKVCCSERDFDNLFWDLWNDYGEQWTEWMKGDKPRTPWMKKDAVTFAKAAYNKEKYPDGFKQLWKERGESVLASWKIDGVPAIHFLALAGGYFDFERAVQFITGKDRPDYALAWFRRFLKSRFADEDMAERAMAEYREKRFAPREPYSLKDEFAKWKRLEKSRLAQESRKARGKRGRVRSKRDKRLGARYKGKRILPSKKI